MSNPNLDAVRSIYQAFSTGDVPAVLARFHDDIVWNEADDFPYADGNPYTGPESVLNGVFARCISEWDGFRVEIDELLDAGDTIVALGHYRGVHKQTGRAQNTQLVHVWRMRDAKAVRFQQYANTLHVAQVSGNA